MQRRLLYLDVLRGFFILYLVWLHAFTAIVFGNDPQTVNTVSPWIFIILAPLAILATWAPIFALISGTANAYMMYSAVRSAVETEKRQQVLRQLFYRGLVVSGLLYFFSLLNMAFMHQSMEFNGAFRHTLLTSTLLAGKIHPFSAQLLFYNDALALIATTGLVSTVVLYALWSKGGFVWKRRNYWVLTGLALGIFALSPVLHGWWDQSFYSALDQGHYLKAGILKLFIGPNQSPFPNVSFGLFGVLFGIALAQKAPVARIRRFGYGFAALFLLTGIVLITQQGVKVIELTSHTFPIKLHCINMALMLTVCTILITRFEYASPEKRRRFALWTVPLRRVGMAALTVFLLEGTVSVLISKIYLVFWNTPDSFPRNPVAIGGFILCLFLFWHLALRLWERYDFKYSFEWLVVHCVARVRGRRSSRLNAEVVLYGETHSPESADAA